MTKFEVGKQVALFPNIGAARLADVTRITPGGNVEVAGRLFDGETGKERGAKSWRADRIELATDTNRAHIERAQAFRRVNELKRKVSETAVPNNMSAEKLLALKVALESVVAALEEGKAA